jgi:DNA-binding GntR family transcriptional regulator
MPKKTMVGSAKSGLKTLKSLEQRKPLGQMVYENLRQAIVRGGISAATRLVESQIAEAQGISRTPVREAMHKLEREGFIEKLPHGGFTVLGLSRQEIVETFGIRSVLEGYAARLAALNYQPGDLTPLQAKIDEFQRLLKKKQLKRLAEINTQFHDLLYALSRSPRLMGMIDGLRDQIFRFRQIILQDERRAAASHADHQLMLERIRQRDPAGVEQLVREHILKGQEMVLEALVSSE